MCVVYDLTRDDSLERVCELFTPLITFHNELCLSGDPLLVASYQAVQW